MFAWLVSIDFAPVIHSKVSYNRDELNDDNRPAFSCWAKKPWTYQRYERSMVVTQVQDKRLCSLESSVSYLDPRAR